MAYQILLLVEDRKKIGISSGQATLTIVPIMCDCNKNNNEYLLYARYSSEGILCNESFKSYRSNYYYPYFTDKKMGTDKVTCPGSYS